MSFSEFTILDIWFSLYFRNKYIGAILIKHWYLVGKPQILVLKFSFEFVTFCYVGPLLENHENRIEISKQNCYILK